MKEIAKYIGAIVLIIGVAVMIIPFIAGSTNNSSLFLGILLIINGILGYIYVNNMKKGTVLSNILWALFLMIIPFILYYFAKKVAYTKEEFTAYN